MRKTKGAECGSPAPFCHPRIANGNAQARSTVGRCLMQP